MRAVPVDPSLVDCALAGVAERMTRLRRDLHAHPELSWRESRTTEAVAEHLRQAGLEPVGLGSGTGLVCDVPAGAGPPRVALRADLDALPIQDDKDVAYRSTVPGVAHACGHDVHTSVVLGAGLGLARLAAAGDLPGAVRLVFQPAEEVIPGGAQVAIASGVLDGVERVYALHCDPRVDAGAVGVRAGAMTGATDLLSVKVSGPGGHTARPQLTVDLVGALADVVARTQAILAKRADPRRGLSLVWGRIAAGSAPNVIPHSGEAAGSIRTLDLAAWQQAEQLVPEIIRQVLAPYGIDPVIDYTRGVPPAVNDAAAVADFGAAATAILGPGAVVAAEQSMGAEDFAWMLERVPGVLARLGVRRPGAEEAPDLHRGDFDIDERAIGAGSRLLVAVALDALRRG